MPSSSHTSIPWQKSLQKQEQNQLLGTALKPHKTLWQSSTTQAEKDEGLKNEGLDRVKNERPAYQLHISLSNLYQLLHQSIGMRALSEPCLTPDLLSD